MHLLIHQQRIGYCESIDYQLHEKVFLNDRSWVKGAWISFSFHQTELKIRHGKIYIMYTYRAINQRLNKVDYLQEEVSSIVSVGLVNSKAIS